MFFGLFQEEPFGDMMERHIEEDCLMLLDNDFGKEKVSSDNKKGITSSDDLRIPLSAVKSAYKDFRYYYKFMNPKAKKLTRILLRYEHGMLDSHFQGRVWDKEVKSLVEKLSRMGVYDD